MAPSTSNVTFPPFELPGILKVTLFEHRGSVATDRYRALLDRTKCMRWRDAPSYHHKLHLPYAVLDHDKSQVAVASIGVRDDAIYWGLQEGISHSFDVLHIADLIVSLHLKDTDDCVGGMDPVFGVARLRYFPGATTRWVEFSNGAGKLRVRLEYMHVQQTTPVMSGNHSAPTPLKSCNGKIGYKRNTGQAYAYRRIPTADLTFVPAPMPQHIEHPFIAPLISADFTPEDAWLLSPFISGGHLLNHLQRRRRFDIQSATLYAAEIICAIEHLHNVVGIFSWLKPTNILLDLTGHVTICGFGLFQNHFTAKKESAYRMPEYPAPEVLIGSRSKAADWWTVGVLLYEMLTGLPPFYDENPQTVRDKILSAPLKISESIPSSAVDILSRLLIRKPDERLGANGTAEVKAHAFFRTIDWQKLLRREYDPAMQPTRTRDSLVQVGVREARKSNPSARDGSQMFEPFTYRCPTPDEEAETTFHPKSHADEWYLVLGESTPAHYFYNPVSKEKWTIASGEEQTYQVRWAIERGHVNLLRKFLDLGPQIVDRVAATTSLGFAVLRQDAAATQILLANNIQCDFRELDRPSPGVPGLCYFEDPSRPEDFIPPLVRAVQRDNLELARLLLAHGADVNVSYHDLRVDLNGPDVWLDTRQRPFHFSCGRPVLLAMELGHSEVVRLLLDSGADLTLAPPVWLAGSHECKFVSRATYQKVVARLEREL